MFQYMYTERVRAVNNKTSIQKKQIKGDKVLFLGYGEESTNLIQFLRESGFEVTHENEILKTEDGSGFDLLVSYGYRHKIPMTKRFFNFFMRHFLSRSLEQRRLDTHVQPSQALEPSPIPKLEVCRDTHCPEHPKSITSIQKDLGIFAPPGGDRPRS